MADVTRTAAEVHARFINEVVVGRRVDLLSELFHPEAKADQGSFDDLRARLAAQAQGFERSVQFLHAFVDGDWATHHMSVTVKNVGDFRGYPASGRYAHFHEVQAARVVEGKIVDGAAVSKRTGVAHIRNRGSRSQDRKVGPSAPLLDWIRNRGRLQQRP
jgi:hypothetical protein